MTAARHVATLPKIIWISQPSGVMCKDVSWNGGFQAAKQLQAIRMSQTIFCAKILKSCCHVWPTRWSTATKTVGLWTKLQNWAMVQVHWWQEIQFAAQWGKLYSSERWRQTQIIVHSNGQHSSTCWSDRLLESLWDYNNGRQDLGAQHGTLYVRTTLRTENVVDSINSNRELADPMLCVYICFVLVSPLFSLFFIL